MWRAEAYCRAYSPLLFVGLPLECLQIKMWCLHSEWHIVYSPLFAHGHYANQDLMSVFIKWWSWILRALIRSHWYLFESILEFLDKNCNHPVFQIKRSIHGDKKVASMCAFKRTEKLWPKPSRSVPSGIGYLGWVWKMVSHGNRHLVTTYASTPETTPRT